MVIFYVIVVSGLFLVVEFLFRNVLSEFGIIVVIDEVVVFGFCFIGEYDVKRFIGVFVV